MTRLGPCSNPDIICTEEKKQIQGWRKQEQRRQVLQSAGEGTGQGGDQGERRKGTPDSPVPHALLFGDPTREPP